MHVCIEEESLKIMMGDVLKLSCPFHGFAWELDGDLKDVPAEVGLSPC